MKKSLSFATMGALAATIFVFGAVGTASATLWDCDCQIDGAQENPPTGSTGTGTGTFLLDDVAATLDYNITFSGLSAAETAAHIHGPAPVGTNAGVLFGLGTGDPKIGQWAGISPADISSLTNGLTYVNIHSSNFPGGEIRGQITCAPATAIEESSWGQIKQLFR